MPGQLHRERSAAPGSLSLGKQVEEEAGDPMGRFVQSDLPFLKSASVRNTGRRADQEPAAPLCCVGLLLGSLASWSSGN